MKKLFLLGILLTVCFIIFVFVFAQVYPERMISYWKFDEGIGTIATDLVDANDGEIYGATWTSGIVGSALSFDGVDDYVYVPDKENLSTPYELTVEVWIKSDTFNSDKRIISKHDVWNRGWLLHWEYGNMRFMVN